VSGAEKPFAPEWSVLFKKVVSRIFLAEYILVRLSDLLSPAALLYKTATSVPQRRLAIFINNQRHQSSAAI